MFSHLVKNSQIGIKFANDEVKQPYIGTHRAYTEHRTTRYPAHHQSSCTLTIHHALAVSCAPVLPKGYMVGEEEAGAGGAEVRRALSCIMSLNKRVWQELLQLYDIRQPVFELDEE